MKSLVFKGAPCRIEYSLGLYAPTHYYSRISQLSVIVTRYILAQLTGDRIIMKYLRSITKSVCTLFVLSACQQPGIERPADLGSPNTSPVATAAGQQPPTGSHYESTSVEEPSESIAIAEAAIKTGVLADLDSTPLQDVVAQKVTIDDQRAAATEVTSGNVWDGIRAGFQLDTTVEDVRIADEMRWYAAHQDYLDRVTVRASRYLYHVLGEVDKRALPTELVLLPVVESAYDPFAYSHGRAMGIWQFIPGTGKLFGLKKNWWYDGRRDIQAATEAALNYLEALHGEFDDDWLLALAAYNSGAGKVRSAIRKNRQLGKPIDFWSLKLPLETRTYVPKLLAIARLVANPPEFNVRFSEIEDQPYWVQVDTGSQIDLALAAELAEISVEELYLLNPAFSRWATHPEGPHQLLIPAGQGQVFKQNLEQLSPEKRVAWLRHKILPGESLGLIAWKYGTTASTIKQVNGLTGTVIIAGRSLLIPSALQGQDSYKLSRDERLKATQTSLQHKHGNAPLKHEVVVGDNLWDISRKYKVNVRALAKWNGLATTGLLHPGTELSIWTRPSSNVIVSSTHDKQRSEVIRKVNYHVRKGESLSLIADKFNLSVKNIEKWNSQLIGKRYIQPGQRLVLYVDVIQAE
jgi:membrane-bound lytic murein transglycosylase D